MNDPSGLSSPYTLTEMAMDAVDLLDHIGQSGAHVVGVSMGGMIAQRLAMHFPVRTFSISCIMSSTGNPDLSPPTADGGWCVGRTQWRSPVVTSRLLPGTPRVECSEVLSTIRLSWVSEDLSLMPMIEAKDLMACCVSSVRS